jgi:glycylpeptide N-tetradecanoyltransferase
MQVLPDEFEWCQPEKDTIVEFLNKNYSEDPKSLVRPNITVDFLNWREGGNYLGIRVKNNQKLVGVIASYPVTLKYGKQVHNMHEITFLCLHNKVRGKKLASLLIRTFTEKMDKCFYGSTKLTEGVVAKCSYYHRALNAKLLYDTGFIKLQDTNLEETVKALQLPGTVVNSNFVCLEEKDIEGAFNVLNGYFEKYTFRPVFTLEQFRRLFYDNKVVVCYVLRDDAGKVVDMASYYNNCLECVETGKLIRQGNLYYYSSNVETPFRLIKDMMIVARNNGVDVFTAQESMETGTVLKELKFDKGNNVLNYCMMGVAVSKAVLMKSQMAVIVI